MGRERPASEFERRRDSPFGVTLFAGVFVGFVVFLVFVALDQPTAMFIVLGVWIVWMAVWAFYMGGVE